MRNLTASFACLLCIGSVAPREKWAVEYGGTGNELMPLCRAAVRSTDEPKEDFTKQEIYNTGGIADFIQDDATLTGIPRGQLIRVVQKYMTDHPEELNKGSSWLVRQAIVKAFPKGKK